MSAQKGLDVSADVEAAADARRIQPVDAASMAVRPTAVATTYAELEYDELAAEQEPLWTAEGANTSRTAEMARDGSQAAHDEALLQLEGQRIVLDNARDAYVATSTALRAFRRREPGAKRWYLTRWGFLLGGDVAGQAGAALSYGEPYITAIPQALATGMAALTAGMVGGELRDLRNAARRQRHVDQLSDELKPWEHLFRVPDLGRGLAHVALGLGAVAGLTIAGGIFWLRSIIEGSEGGAVYGLLALGIALASAINAYFYADEIADQIDAAESDYKAQQKGAELLASHPELKLHASSLTEVVSIREESGARGEAAAKRLSALKWRVLGNNPGVAGHGLGGEPDPMIGRRSRGGDAS